MWESTQCRENALGLEAGARVTNDTTSSQRTCGSTPGPPSACKMMADPHLIQGGLTYVFHSENGKHVNQTPNLMGGQKGNTIFLVRSAPAAAVRTERAPTREQRRTQRT